MNAAMTEQGYRVSTMREHNGGRITWRATVMSGHGMNAECIAELTGYATEDEALVAGQAYQEPAPEAQTECPRAANRRHHYEPSCMSWYCIAQRTSRNEAAVQAFVAIAQCPGFEVRSRSEFGGTLTLYRYDASSPTGVFGESSISDTRENRALLARAGVTIYMGAY
jgi:hypothetical protein